MLNQKIFREYDIRGIVGKDFDAELAERLGRAFADTVATESLGSDSRDYDKRSGLVVAVGHDCRQTADEMRDALIKGLLAGGVSVRDCGMGPTPQLYHSVVLGKLAGGIQVTASHNPGEYNGFKMMVGMQTLSGADIARLRDAIVHQQFSEGKAKGTLEKEEARAEYLADLTNRSRDFMGSRKLKVVVDGGNGVGGLVGPDLLRNLGCEVIELYTEPDGSFPNHHPDPTELENLRDLQARVVSEKADLGIAWDGDADRIGVVDEKGAAIFGDMLLVIFGRALLKEIKKPIIVGDVKCSELMFQDLREKGAETVMARTGHSLIKAKLKELNAHLAGEMSGHMFFVHRYLGFDDAIHASARIVEILSNEERPLSSLLVDLPKVYSTPEIRVDCEDEYKFQVAEKAPELFSDFDVDTLDGARITFPDGWGLVRASNTQPALVMRFEAQSKESLEKYRGLVEGRIRDLQAELAG